MKRILITGCTGFIGDALRHRFLQGSHFDVVYLVREESRHKIKDNRSNVIFFSDDKEIISSLKNRHFDAIIHLATYFCRTHQLEEIQKLIDSNITFGTSVLEGVSHNQELLFINADTYFYKNLNGELVPETLYAASKSAFKEILKFYSNEKKIKVINISITDTYGPNDPRDKLIKLIVKSIKEKTHFEIRSPDKEINLLHIDDVIDALIYTLNNHTSITQKNFSSYSIRNPNKDTIRNLIDSIERLVQTKYIKMGTLQESAPLGYFNPLPLPGWTPKKILNADEIVNLINQTNTNP